MKLYSSLICDIPMFYTRWLYNRFEDGYFVKKVAENKYVKFSIDHVENLISFSRDFQKLIDVFPSILKHCESAEIVQEISFYEYFYQNILASAKPLKSFREITRMVGKKHASFSYGPIIKTDEITLDTHKNHLRMIFDILGNLCSKIYLDYNVGMSFCDSANPYGCFSDDEKRELFIFAQELFARKKIDVLRKPCLTHLPKDSIDMGEINMCQHGCKICQGINRSILKSYVMAMHDPKSPALSGPVAHNLKTTLYKESLADKQTTDAKQIKFL